VLADSDDAIREADALLAAEITKQWSPPSIDETCTWGKHKGRTYRELARRDPAYAKWAASTIPGLKGQLCAEALAVHLGVDE
jgi:hypothetical protein